MCRLLKHVITSNIPSKQDYIWFLFSQSTYFPIHRSTNTTPLHRKVTNHQQTNHYYIRFPFRKQISTLSIKDCIRFSIKGYCTSKSLSDRKQRSKQDHMQYTAVRHTQSTTTQDFLHLSTRFSLATTNTQKLHVVWFCVDSIFNTCKQQWQI